MVVGGVPISVSNHTERVASFALGMIIAAKEVTNPVTGGPIQVTTANFLDYYAGMVVVPNQIFHFSPVLYINTEESSFN